MLFQPTISATSKQGFEPSVASFLIDSLIVIEYEGDKSYLSSIVFQNFFSIIHKGMIQQFFIGAWIDFLQNLDLTSIKIDTVLLKYWSRAYRQL